MGLFSLDLRCAAAQRCCFCFSLLLFGFLGNGNPVVCLLRGSLGSSFQASDLRIPEQKELSEAQAKGNDSQLFVDQWLRVCGAPDGSIIALGDCARMKDEDPLPQTAQVAAQQGAYVARLLNKQYDLATESPRLAPSSSEHPFDVAHFASIRGHTEASPFRFLDLGRLAYLGQSEAVAELGVGSTTVSQAKGQAAFLLWRSVYIVKQVSFRNRVLVLFDWIKSRLFGRDLTRF